MKQFLLLCLGCVILSACAIQKANNDAKLEAAHNYIKALEYELDLRVSDSFVDDCMSGTDEYAEYYK